MSSPPLRRQKAERDLLDDGIRRHHPSGQLAEEEDPSPERLLLALRREAELLGLPRLGVTDTSPLVPDEGRFVDWLAAGHAGDMSYLVEGASSSSSVRAHPRSLLPEARSVIVVGLSYSPPQENRDPKISSPGLSPALQGVVAAYARGMDYHHVLKDRLLILADVIADLVGRPVLARACVDTAPLLERALAVRAGLGFVAKNTMLIVPGQGSYVLLGELFVDVDFQTTSTNRGFDGCGRCRACLDACPTQAFPSAFVLDGRRCVSYLTIESPAELPLELRAGIGTRVFGCDECQSVCPYNQTAYKKPFDPELAPHAHLDVVDLEKLLFLGSAAYRTFVRGSSLKRTHRAQLCRNAAIALGNTGKLEAVAPLRRALLEHPLLLARTYSAWALGRLAYDFGWDEARRALDTARDHADVEVREEIRRWREPPGPTA